MIDGATLARAFSPRRNLRALFEPSPSHLAPLDGVRAFAILWTILFHTTWPLFGALPRREYVALVTSPWLLPAWRGHFGVDVFFVLSGFLIAGILIDERARTGRIALGNFYVRRLMRLWPALLVAIVLVLVDGRARPELLWTNALYLSNFAPATGMGWTWSLAIEEHFYLVCPWLIEATGNLGTRVRIGVLSAIVVGLVAIAAVVVVRGAFHAIDSEIVVLVSPGRWGRAFAHLYDKPWMRAGALLSGAIAALVHRNARAREAIARSGWGGTALLALAFFVGWQAGNWPRFALGPRWLEVAYLASYRSVFGACTAIVILFALSEHRVGRVIGRVLSLRVLHPIAQLAYAAYLVNPIFMHHAAVFLAARMTLTPLTLYAVAFPLELVITLAVALAVHLLVERPFMELRPRVPRDAPVAPQRALSIQLAAMIGLAVVLPIVLMVVVPALTGPVLRHGQVEP